MAVLWKYGVPGHTVSFLEKIYARTWCQLKMEGEVSEWFEAQTGVRQGCVLSPILFICYMDNIMREAIESMSGGEIKNETILRRANEVPIEGQLKHRGLQLLGHVTRMNRNRVQRLLHCSRLTGKVCPRVCVCVCVCACACACVCVCVCGLPTSIRPYQ